MAGNTQAGGLKILWTTATIDFASTAANDVTDSSGVTLTGAVMGDPCIIGDNTAPPGKGMFYPFVSAADEVKVRFVNNDDAAVDPASRTFVIGVVKLVSYT